MVRLKAGSGQAVSHPFPPVIAPDSRILILGSMPSVPSRKQGYYYGNPQNRFWRVLARLFDEPVPESTEDRHTFLISHQIAVWDVLAECTITGSQDSSIRKPQVNDLTAILAAAPIGEIFTNGQTAAQLYSKYCESQTGRHCIALPSTSPANAHLSLDGLCLAWQPVREALIG